MRWKGSYTVEAAFVIPIVLGVVFVLLYALFWVHDQCVLQANIQNGLIQYSDTGEELPTNEEWKRTLQQNLWMGNVTRKQQFPTKGRCGKGRQSWNLYGQNDLTAIFFADSQNSVYCLEWDEQQPSDIVRFRRKGQSMIEIEQGTGKYVTIAADEETALRWSGDIGFKMMQYNQIRGVLPISQQYIDERLHVYYEVNKMQTLESMYAEAGLSVDKGVEDPAFIAADSTGGRAVFFIGRTVCIK